MSEQPDIMVWRKKSRVMASRLKQIVSSNSLSQEKIDKAKKYLDEIISYRNILPESATVVDRKTFLDVTKKSNFAELKDTGYIQVATLKKTYKHKYYVCMAPLTEFL